MLRDLYAAHRRGGRRGQWLHLARPWSNNCHPVWGDALGKGGKLARHADELIGTAKKVDMPGTVVTRVNDLARAAGHLDSQGLSAAGRALQKHSGRSGSAFALVTGPPSNWTQAAQSFVDDILTDPGSTFTNRIAGRFGKVLDVRAPDGRGIRFGSDGSFIHFLEPPR